MPTIADIRERLTEIRPPGAGRDLVSLGAVEEVAFRDGRVVIDLRLPEMPPPARDVILTDIKRAIGAFDGVAEVEVRLAPPGAPASAPGLPGVRYIIAVSSAKGGVGKSTVATNLAIALARAGHRVGLLDADVYGPSVPTMMGMSGRPEVREDKRILPLEMEGIRVMSIGFFLDDSSPVIWRGPMVMGLVRQFLQDVEWGELDFLLIDLPPGTGDTQLTLVQQVPLAGGIVVTTPQDVATLDVERGIAMFERVHTPLLGIVENMSDFECPACGKHDDIFGTGGAARIAEKHGIALVARIPLQEEIRMGGDSGRPIVAAKPEHPTSAIFRELAQTIVVAVEAARADSAPPTIID